MKNLFVPLIAILLLLQGCIGDDIIFDSIQADLRFNNPIDTLAIGESYQLEVTFLNELGQATAAELSWTSSAPTVIEVDETGRITGLSEGSAVISSATVYKDETIQATLQIATGNATVISQPTARTGTLQTTSSYTLQGSFSLEEQDNGLVLKMAEDYKASSSLPGLYVYLTNNPNTINGALEVSMVNNFEGAVNFQIPAGVGLSDYNYVLFYCKPFGVKVGDGAFDN